MSAENSAKWRPSGQTQALVAAHVSYLAVSREEAGRTAADTNSSSKTKGCVWHSGSSRRDLI